MAAVNTAIVLAFVDDWAEDWPAARTQIVNAPQLTAHIARVGQPPPVDDDPRRWCLNLSEALSPNAITRVQMMTELGLSRGFGALLATQMSGVDNSRGGLGTIYDTASLLSRSIELDSANPIPALGPRGGRPFSRWAAATAVELLARATRHPDWRGINEAWMLADPDLARLREQPEWDEWRRSQQHERAKLKTTQK